MIYAVGKPGSLPRLLVETTDQALALAQLAPGEVLHDSVAIGSDGGPVIEPIPENATNPLGQPA